MDSWTETPPADWFLAAEHKYVPPGKSDITSLTTSPAAYSGLSRSSWDRAMQNTFDMCQQLGI